MAFSIEDLLHRRRGAWDEFYDQHVHDVYGFVYHLVHSDRAVTDDLFQEIWLQALEGIRSFDPERGDLRGWLMGISRRRVALYWRLKYAAERRVEFVDSELHQDDALLPADVLEQLERASVVRAALLAIPEDQRSVLIHKYVDGLSVDQIAVHTGKSSKAVESMLTRARSRLRVLLGPEFRYPDGAESLNTVVRQSTK